MSLLEHLRRPSVVRSMVHLDDRHADRPVPPPAVREELPRVVIVSGGPAEVVGDLLLAVARGDREAFIALESRMGGLVRVNIRRVLRDASRSDAVTQEFFAEVLRDAVTFDPDRESPQAWLLTRAHQRALDGFAADTLQVVNGPSSRPRSTDPADDALGDRPVEVIGVGAPDVSADRAALLPL